MLPRLSVRLFRPADLERILEIERASFGADAYDRKLFAELSHNCGDLFLVAVRGGNVCGYIVTCMRGNRAPDAAELVSLAVDPPYRGQGMAAGLFKNTLRRLRLRKVARLTLMVKVSNETARRFYERHGFRRVRRVAAYYEDGSDGLLMSRRMLVR